MASTYSDLKIELIGTGEQSGTWGTTTNTNLGTALGEAITGSADVSFSSADVTVTLTDSNAAQTARNLRLNLTGTTGGARNLILGSGCQIEKLYLINNGTADTITVKNTTGTGIAVPAGKSMFVFNNGTNVVDAVTHLTSLTLGTDLAVADGGTGISSGTSGGILYFSASGTLASSGVLASNAIVLGGGAGTTPATTTTGTGVVTAVGNAVNTTGGLVTQSGTLASSAILLGGGASTAITSTTTGTGVVTAVGNAVNTTGGLVTQSGTLTANNILLGGGASTAITSSSLLATSAAVTSGTYIKSIGYADTVVALGNTGTAINLDVVSGGVFTATLTGNATITLRYPVSSGSSSFTLILTNDGTAGRTVAWAGGSFKFPGGAASLSRTTTANAIDIWVFFTPDGGTTWYGNIAMKNMTA